MALTRWNPTPQTPIRDLVNIQDELDRLFGSVFSRGSVRGDQSAIFAPPVDIEETPEGFVVRADLPGVSQKDVKVSLMSGTLTIRGERTQEESRREGNYHRLERVYGTFERSFDLGTAVRADQVKAHYKDGVLEIFVPKAEEAKLREIEVQVAQG
jgi:HSP20 family protein